MLKVTVAEVQRSLLKQFGINLGAMHQRRQLLDRAADRERAAAHGRGRSRHAAVPGIGTQARSTTGHCATSACSATAIRAPAPARSATPASTSVFDGGNTQMTSGAARARARRPDPHAGRAEPDGGLGRDREVPGRRRVSRSRSSTATASCPSPSRSSASASPSRPIVLSEGRISLKIETEVSELTNDGAVVLSNISHPGAEEAPGEVDRRAAVGRLAGDRRPDLRVHAPEHRRLPRPQGRAGARHAVPQPRLHQAGDRARRHRHALPGAPDRAPEPGTPRRRPRARLGSEGQLPRPSQSDLRQGPTSCRPAA